MAVINEIIRIEPDRTLSFGNYLATDKQKLGDFKLGNDTYKVKTHNELTRFERNNMMLLETVPGAAIHNFNLSENSLVFEAEGTGNTQFTIGLEPDTEYNVYADDMLVDKAKSGLSGKINFSRELSTDSLRYIKIEKV